MYRFQCNECMMSIEAKFSEAIGDNDRKVVLRHIRCVFTDHETEAGHSWNMVIS